MVKSKIFPDVMKVLTGVILGLLLSSSVLNSWAAVATTSVDVTTINGVATTMGNGVSGTGVQRVTIASDSTGQIALAAGSATIGALTANQSVNTAQINGVAPTMGNGISGTGVQRVTLASDSTGQVALAAGSATIGALTANQSVNTAQINGVAPTMGNGIAGTGVQRVTIASDSTGQVALAAGTATIGALTANQSVNVAQINGVATTMGNGISGTGVQRVTLASDSTGQVALAAGSATIGALTANQSVNTNQLGGVAISLNTGVRDTGTQRVTIATNDVVPASQSGTWTVQPGNTANTSAWLATNYATRSDTYTAVASGTTLDVSTRPTGQFGIQVIGTGAAATAWSVVLEGSLDNANFTTILTHGTTTGDGVSLWTGGGHYPALYFRSRVVSLTLGSATNIVVKIVGSQ